MGTEWLGVPRVAAAMAALGLLAWLVLQAHVFESLDGAAPVIGPGARDFPTAPPIKISPRPLTVGRDGTARMQVSCLAARGTRCEGTVALEVARGVVSTRCRIGSA